MMLKVAMTILLSQYVRSRVSDRDSSSQCLWWPENAVIEVRQAADGNPETPGDAEFSAIGAAIAAWQAQLGSCASLRLVDGARTATRAVGYFDQQANENVTVFRLRKCADVVPQGDACWGDADDCGTRYDCWQHQSAAIAITTTSFNPKTGRILDSDIEFNTPNFVFSAVDSPACVGGRYVPTCVATDVQNTATHELGHLLGLGHSPDLSSTMAARAVPGELAKRVLDADTARFVCDVYPAGGAARTCVVAPASDSLGKAVGCQAAPGLLALAAGTWLLRRRRAR
jgi:hypothetical protein